MSVFLLLKFRPVLLCNAAPFSRKLIVTLHVSVSCYSDFLTADVVSDETDLLDLLLNVLDNLIFQLTAQQSRVLVPTDREIAILRILY